MSLQKKMKLNLNIVNEQDEDFIIKNIILISKIPDISLETILNPKNFKSSNFKNIFDFKKSTEFLIPINLICNSSYSGSLGQIEIYYKTKGLEDFNENLYNKINFNLPDYNFKGFDIELVYSIPKNIKMKENFDFNIFIKNKTQGFKRLMLLIDNTQYFIINGRVKERIVLKGNEDVVKVFNLIPLNFGKLKLPAFKIMEYPYDSSNYDNKNYSIYYFPDSIHIN